MRTCSWRSVTHQLKRPSLTHSTFPSWLTNIGLWKLTWKFLEMWGVQSNIPTCQHWTVQSWWRGQRSPGRHDQLSHSRWSWCFGRKAQPWTFRVNIHIPRLQCKDQPLEIISLSVECQFCTFSYAAWCCTWIVCFMDFQESIWKPNCHLQPSFGGRMVASSHLKAGVLPFDFASYCPSHNQTPLTYGLDTSVLLKSASPSKDKIGMILWMKISITLPLDNPSPIQLRYPSRSPASLVVHNRIIL